MMTLSLARTLELESLQVPLVYLFNQSLEHCLLSSEDDKRGAIEFLYLVQGNFPNENIPARLNGVCAICGAL